ncbi:MAG: GDP-L-fucose synthase, partial [Candidatus Omnitrophica bacterium]|nr:GDP-L-fucose synthase [Candidatus Omnitrophota bacterium]
VREVVVPRKSQYNLVEQTGIEKLFADHRIDYVIHAAGTVGGIGANRANPGLFFYDNIMMGVQLIEQCRLRKIAKTVIIGTICSYPKFAPIPFREEDLWEGYPEETNAPYGLAKKMLIVQARAYREQYGLNSICLLPVNMYGPRDHFDLENSHVIPALIRKCVTAKEEGEKEIVCWGDGSPTREFLFARDAAEGVVLALKRYDGPEPVNLGTGIEISIRDLVTIIAEATGFTGQVRWDATRPNGQPRRCLDTAKAEKLFGFKARTPFSAGVKETVEWYLRAGKGNESATQLL